MVVVKKIGWKELGRLCGLVKKENVSFHIGFLCTKTSKSKKI
jgi:hypothetical protein